MRALLWTIVAGCGHEPSTHHPRSDETGATGDTAVAATPDSCVDQVVDPIAPTTVSGSTFNGGDDLQPSCAGSGSAPDVVLSYTAPAAGEYVFDTAGSTFDIVLAAYDACGGSELACDDDGDGPNRAARLRMHLDDGQTVLLGVDGYTPSPAPEGNFSLRVSTVPEVETSCADGEDEDQDALLDCLDPDCAPDPACSDACPELQLDPTETIQDSTLGATDSFTSWCDGGVAPDSDRTIRFVAPSPGRWMFDAEGDWDVVLSLRTGCGGDELVCSDNSYGSEKLSRDMKTGDSVLVVVGGWLNSSGPYTLTAQTIDPVEHDCADYLDEDYDGLWDCEDPDCDLDPACPEKCANGVDDDGDGRLDCLDGACAAAPTCQETCPPVDTLDGAFPIVVYGSTLGRPDAYTPTCHDTDTSDVSWSFTAPEDGLYTFDTVGSAFDTLLYVLDGCGGTELACDDDSAGYYDSRVQVQLTADQTVVVVVDGTGTNSGDYVLRVDHQ